MATVGKLAVIVAQYGADVSACVASHRRDEAVEVVQQTADESATQLTSRVRESVSRLVSAGYHVHSASFVARGGFDVRDVMATAGLLRGLVATMVAVGAGHVHIHAETPDVQTRYALTALTNTISEQLQGTGVEFHTDFISPMAEPPSAAAAAPDAHALESATVAPPSSARASP
jgi:hypothetical protein